MQSNYFEKNLFLYTLLNRYWVNAEKHSVDLRVIILILECVFIILLNKIENSNIKINESYCYF